MYELVGIMVGLNLINVFVSLLIVNLLVKCYCLIKDDEFDIKNILGDT